MPINENLRNRILDDLSGHFSRDRLSMEEYEQRVQAVNMAKDDLELLRVNEDILPPARYERNQQPASESGGPLINYGDAPASHDAIAIFSGSTMEGEYRAPRKINAVSIFGGTVIDLRKAMIPADGIVIDAVAIFGGISVILPAGVAVEVHGVGIFGGFDRPPNTLDEHGPRIRINGTAVFGGVEIKRPRASLS